MEEKPQKGESAVLKAEPMHLTSEELAWKLEALMPVWLQANLDSNSVKTDTLRPTVVAFRANAIRIKHLSFWPLELAGVSFTLGRDGHATAGWLRADQQTVKKESLEAIRMVESMAVFGAGALQAWLGSVLVSVWTVFETLAGDLWIATVNANPHLLARLNGTAKRIHERAKAAFGEESSSASKQDNDMSVPVKRIHDITNGKYNISMKMGELLKSKVVFTRLWDIRRAYSLAFDEKKLDGGVLAAVDAALADGALDAIAAVRNMIVHKASIADEEYVKRSKCVHKAGLSIPQLDIGQRLRLDGEIVMLLTVPVMACCLNLITAIDGWLDACSSPPGYAAGLGI